MPYNEKAAAVVMQLFGEATSGLARAAILCTVSGGQQPNPKARMYLREGVARRLGVMERCVRNVFSIHPVAQSARLPLDALQDLNINLQAFVMNLIGVQDNLAWAFVHKNDIQLDRVDVALHRKRFQKLLPQSLQTVLTEDRFVKWHDRYARDYRDTLAHRIPFFVPPAEYTSEEAAEDTRLAGIWAEQVMFGDMDVATQAHESRLLLGRASHRFFHLEGTEPEMLFHAQLLKDAQTTHYLVDEFATRAFDP